MGADQATGELFVAQGSQEMMANVTDFFRKTQFRSSLAALRWDLTRLRARRQTNQMIKKFMKENSGSIPERLHLGCGERIVSGWLNCDVIGSQVTIDLACGHLPFESNHFTAVCAQHLIEHLWIDRELEPLLGEVYRCMKSDGELWLSCPDLEKVCKHYCEDKGIGMLEDRLTRFPDAAIHDYPASHMINRTFHQGGEHKNLFDFDLLKFVLEKSGFAKVKNENELSFLTRFPEFPKRGDDYHSLYVSAKKIR